MARTTFSGPVKSDNGFVVTLSNASISLTALPTSDPGVAGRLWNDGGTLKISAGA